MRRAPKPIIHLCACGDHAFRALNRGFMTMVSAEDAKILLGTWSVSIHKFGNRFYAVVALSRSRGMLSRAVMKPSAHLVVDHISRDTMDNRRSNLRVCTRAENQRNRAGWKSRVLPKGVDRSGGKFVARIHVDGRKLHLGTFDTPDLAAAAYASAASQHFGEFARAA